jgi:hypothetical protein
MNKLKLRVQRQRRCVASSVTRRQFAASL